MFFQFNSLICLLLENNLENCFKYALHINLVFDILFRFKKKLIARKIE